MATKFVIPSIFSVIDDVSPHLDKMKHNVSAFGTRSEMAVARADRAFKRLTPGLGGLQKEILGLVGAGTLIAGGMELGRFSFESIKDYEVAVDSFHTIVSDLNDTDFSKFQNEIDRVAKVSKKSGTDVANTFERIAGLNADFAQTAKGLGQVSSAAIVLAKASRMDLGPASENLVGIMNQFSFGAEQANRTINVLAAGQAVGAASISQTAEAFTVFGSIAAGANITLEQSVGLIQTLGKYSLFGAEAGTKLRGAILRMQKAGIGYASGQFNINDALIQTNAIMGKLKNSKQKDAVLNKLFGAENITAGRILLSNIDTYKKFTEGVTGTSEAQKAAEINSKNLRGTLDELNAAWVNMITGSAGAKQGIGQVTSGVQWLTANLDQVVDTAISVGKTIAYAGGAMLLFKGYLMATSVATTAINVGIGIYNALFTRSVVLTYANATAQKAYMVTSIAFSHVLEILNGNFAALNAVMMANPVGLVLLGVTALAAGIGYLIYKNKQLREEYERSLNNRIAAAQAGELAGINKLIDANVRLGMSRKQAAEAAIQARRIELSFQQAKNQAQITVLKKRREEIKNEFHLSDLLGVGQFDHGQKAITEKLLPIMQQQTMLASESLALTNFAIGKTQESAPTPSQTFTEKDKFTQKELLSLFTKPAGDASSKSELTVTIKNDSDNTASVSMGKTKITDVQPKTESTKVLRGGK